MLTVSGLKPGDYEFRVRAKNAVGLSEPSNTSGSVSPKPKYSKSPTDFWAGNLYTAPVGLQFPPPVKLTHSMSESFGLKC